MLYFAVNKHLSLSNSDFLALFSQKKKVIGGHYSLNLKNSGPNLFHIWHLQERLHADITETEFFSTIITEENRMLERRGGLTGRVPSLRLAAWIPATLIFMKSSQLGNFLFIPWTLTAVGHHQKNAGPAYSSRSRFFCWCRCNSCLYRFRESGGGECFVGNWLL